MADTKISPAPSAWRVQQLRDGDDVRIIGVEPTAVPAPEDQVTLRSLPAAILEDAPPSGTRYEEIVYSDAALPSEARTVAAANLEKRRGGWPGSEVRTLTSEGGRIDNRINLTIVGDGYTAEQKERFFEDAARIKDELFAESTFKSYLPLFNVHAVFVPSNQSGLTDGEDERDTALGLYRSPAGSKRGVMPGNYDAIDRAVDLAPATDYPILLANDDFYGGLGGQYAITTRSPRSGAMVLRHELGHNFGNVGEEYDGGYVYDGANHSSSPDVPWRAWVDGETQVFEGKPLVGEYPWQNLSSGPVQYAFDVEATKDGDRPTLVIDGSFVGWESTSDVSFLLDGAPIDVQIEPTNDRGFFAIGSANEISPGRHELTVKEQVADGDNMLASIRVTQYAPGYDFTKNLVGAFPSFNDWGSQSGYRPTHESCLMRDMTSKEFCVVDKENMWHEFLERVSLIDDLSVHPNSDAPGGRTVSLELPSLEGLDIQWFRLDSRGAEQAIPELAGQRSWSPPADDHGRYRARVSFSTPEVRVYNNHFTATRDVRL